MQGEEKGLEEGRGKENSLKGCRGRRKVCKEVGEGEQFEREQRQEKGLEGGGGPA